MFDSLLTVTELKVAHLAAEGLCNKEISSKLSMSERTAKFHVSNIMVKFHVTSRRDIRRALFGGLPPIPEVTPEEARIQLDRLTRHREFVDILIQAYRSILRRGGEATHGFQL